MKIYTVTVATMAAHTFGPEVDINRLCDDEGYEPEAGTQFVAKADADALAARVAELERDNRLALDAGNRLARKVAELDAEVEAGRLVIEPLLPLFRERADAWKQRNLLEAIGGGTLLSDPPNIALTAEFPTTALRALNNQRNKQEEKR